MSTRFCRVFVCLALPICAAAPFPLSAEAPVFRVTALAGLDRTDAAPGTGASDGLYVGGVAGLDWDLGGMILGVEGELADSNASAPLVGGTAEQGVFAIAAVRLAVPLSNRIRAFARGGYVYHEIDYGLGASYSGSGYTVGAGGEVDVIGPIFLRGEYRFSDYGSDVRGQQFLGGIGIRF